MSVKPTHDAKIGEVLIDIASDGRIDDKDVQELLDRSEYPLTRKQAEMVAGTMSDGFIDKSERKELIGLFGPKDFRAQFAGGVAQLFKKPAISSYICSADLFLPALNNGPDSKMPHFEAKKITPLATGETYKKAEAHLRKLGLVPHKLEDDDTVYWMPEAKWQTYANLAALNGGPRIEREAPTWNA